MHEWYSINEIIQKSGLTDSTTRRYLKVFKDFLHHETRNKQRRYHGETVAILKRISELYEAKQTTEDIREILRQESMIINVPAENDEASIVPIPITEYLQKQNEALLSALDHMTRQLAEAVKESRASREELQAMNKRIEALEARAGGRKWYHIFKPKK